ncbi:MAG TPA: hydantoinase/oxoprolinase family protein [Burkholderiales bacterium]|nr:hydantoinase/oxoprolinase family protein [Burkholderiales bacterium]
MAASLASPLPQSARAARIGCDIGGTFTDVILQHPDGRLFVNKTSTTPQQPGRAVVAGIRALLAQSGLAPETVGEVVHGTTVASNTILQKTGARTGVLATRGFRDVLEIGRIRTPTMFDLAWQKPEPLAPRRYRLEVDERIAADGSVVRPLDADEVRAAARRFEAEGVEAVAVCFINSYANPAHEIAAKRILEAECPRLLVTASCDVLPEMKEYERTSTTVVNAYILPAMRSYLARLQRDLAAIGIRAPLHVMASNGGMIGIAAASERPVFAVASGPAGGVTGAARLGAGTRAQDLIVFDMGGTTAKASIIEGGAPSLTNEYEFRDGISTPSRFLKGGGYVLKVPAIDIAEVGAGGGSIAAVDAGGLLGVGPQSAGADPGPACYRLGNDRPTVTDANLVLGYLNPVALAGGSLAVDPAAAQAAVAQHVGAPLGLSTLDAAHGIRHIANVNMARAIRAVTVERGRDPRDMALVAFGGSGPTHAVDVARLLGTRRVIVPVMAGVFSAGGMLAADAEHDFLRAVTCRLESADAARLEAAAAALRAQGGEALALEGYGADAVSMVLKADLRFVGQSSELTLALRDGPVNRAALDALRAAFLAAYRETFGYAADEPVELVNLRLSARGHRDDRLAFDGLRVDRAALAGTRGERPASFARGAAPVATPVIARADLDATERAGPLIIESYDTTVVVPPAARVRADAAGNLLLELDP